MTTHDALKLRRSPEQHRSRAGVEAIVSALAELLGAQPIEHITMTAIAEHAGVSKAAIYRYFPTKQAVVRALAERTFGEIREVVDDAASTDGDIVDEIVAGLRWYFERHRVEPFLVQLRNALRADLELAAYDLDDSRSNADALAAGMVEAGYDGDVGSLAERLLLVIDMTDGMVRLIGLVDTDEGRRMEDRFCTMAELLIREGQVGPFSA